MALDEQAVADILGRPGAYYDKERVDYEHVTPLAPRTDELLRQVLAGAGDVLDVGCGKADTLLVNAGHFGHGVGIDENSEHLEIGRRAIAAAGVPNVELIQAKVMAIPLAPERFDVAFSERGPVGHNDATLAAVLGLVRSGGMLFYETIGEWNHHEVRAAFEPGYMRKLSSLGVVTAEHDRLERLGVKVEIAASRLETLRFADFYQWLRYQCTVWRYTGGAIPSWPAQRAQLERFIAANSDPQGRINVTYHTVWAGGRKG